VDVRVCIVRVSAAVAMLVSVSVKALGSLVDVSVNVLGLGKILYLSGYRSHPGC